MAQCGALLFWFTWILLVSGLGISLICWGCAAADAYNGWGKPVANSIAAAIFTVGFVFICIPQYFSAIKRSPVAARYVVRMSAVCASVAFLAAIVYPIVEYSRNETNPPGIEILGAVSYTIIGLLFLLNRRMNTQWLKTMTESNQNAN